VKLLEVVPMATELDVTTEQVVPPQSRRIDNVPLVVKLVPSFLVTRKVTLLLVLLTEVTSSRKVEEVAPPLSVPDVVEVGLAV
jgi:hypothetical protein